VITQRLQVFVKKLVINCDYAEAASLCKKISYENDLADPIFPLTPCLTIQCRKRKSLACVSRRSFFCLRLPAQSKQLLPASRIRTIAQIKFQTSFNKLGLSPEDEFDTINTFFKN